MVETIVAELETLKAKVEEAIAHVKSGVTTLNEDQLEKLHEMLQDIGMGAEAAYQKIGSVVKAATVGSVQKVETGSESLLQKVEGIFEAVKDKAEEVLGIEHKPTEPAAEQALPH